MKMINYSPKAGSWEYLYQLLAASPEAIDRAMAVTIRGDINDNNNQRKSDTDGRYCIR